MSGVAAPWNVGQGVPAPGPAGPAHVNQKWIIRMPEGVDLRKIKSAEELMDEKMQELVEKDHASSGTGGPQSEVFDRLPEHFIVALPDCWPASCNLRCCSCTLTFQGFPWFVPTGLKEMSIPDPCGGEPLSTLAFKRGHVTCSPNCAVTFIETHYDVEKQSQFKELLVHLHHAVTGKRVVHIEKAPCHTELRMYHGKLTIDEFWEKMKALAQKTKLSTRKFDLKYGQGVSEEGTDGWGAAETAPAGFNGVAQGTIAPERPSTLALQKSLLATKHRYPMFMGATSKAQEILSSTNNQQGSSYIDRTPIEAVAQTVTDHQARTSVKVQGASSAAHPVAAPPARSNQRAAPATLEALLGSFPG